MAVAPFISPRDCHSRGVYSSGAPAGPEPSRRRGAAEGGSGSYIRAGTTLTGGTGRLARMAERSSYTRRGRSLSLARLLQIPFPNPHAPPPRAVSGHRAARRTRSGPEPQLCCHGRGSEGRSEIRRERQRCRRGRGGGGRSAAALELGGGGEGGEGGGGRGAGGAVGRAGGRDRGHLELQELVQAAVLQPVAADPAARAHAGGGQGGARAAACGVGGRAPPSQGRSPRRRGAAPARQQRQQDLPGGISRFMALELCRLACPSLLKFLLFTEFRVEL